MAQAATPTGFKWQIKGTVLVACNCEPGCPCNFNALPTHGHCEGGWSWQIGEGEYDGIRLDGLNFSMFGDWPSAIHHGNGQAVVFIDERADERQREALQALVRGEVGGLWAILRNTIVRYDGPHYVPYEVAVQDYHSSVRAGGKLRLELEPIRNPVTGVETHPRITLPEGFVWKEGGIARSKAFRVNDGVSYDHSGSYAAFAPFEYSGPTA